MTPETEFKDVLGHPIEITKSLLEDATPRIVRVRNRFNLDDLSNLYISPSASYLTSTNTLVGVVDAALRINGLVPSWIVEEPISADQRIESGSVFLDRICGAETFFQLLHPSHHLDRFIPAVYLMRNSGQVESSVGADMSRLNLADYRKLVVGVQFIPIEMPIARIIEIWRERYHGLSEGNVQLTQIQDNTGRPLIGAYSLIGGMTTIGPGDLTSERYRLRNTYNNDGQKISYEVTGNSLIAVADAALERKGIYRKQDTYIDGIPDKKSNVYLATVPGLEKSILSRFKVVDPRDIGILVETSNRTERKSHERTEPGNGRLAGNQTKATAGMQYDVVAMIQGVYDRRDQFRS